MTDLVVGSGHSGTLAAYGLLSAGRDVVMLDVGETIEEDRAALRRKLASSEPEAWSPADVDRFREPRQARPTDLIRPYGSDFIFRDPRGEFSELPDWLGLRPSFARGGLSNGWGACVAPYRNMDLDAWPIGEMDLAPYYRDVAQIVPIATAPDDLLEAFPAFDGPMGTPLPTSAQATEILSRFASARDRTDGLGATVGQARQAASGACKRCGLCLYGCPYEYIFSASHLLDRLTKSERFQYVGGQVVIQFEESEYGVRIRTASGEFVGDRLFLGAGVLGTARIVLTSFGVDDEIDLLDSEYFLVPSLHAWSPSVDPAAEPHHTLSQIFIEIVDPGLAPTSIHAQLYTHNDLYEADMRHRYGEWGGLAPPIYRALSRRLVVMQGFLHSDDSGRIGLSAKQSTDGVRLSVTSKPNPNTDAAVGRAMKRLSQVLGVAGLRVLSPFARRSTPGSSFHCGGTFPMRKQPRGLESDILGRPGGLRRVHLVDASTFPSIPATTIAFSTMANALRIATLAE